MAAPAPDDDRWFRRFHPAPNAAVQLLCLPHAGGSASAFFRLSEALAPQVAVVAVQYPGRQDRLAEPCVESIEALAEAVAARVPDAGGQRLALFGHSFGALVAFEVARRLEDRGVTPVALFASGSRAPVLRRARPPRDRDDAELAAIVQRLTGADVGIFEDEDVRRMVMPSLRADHRALDAYGYRPGPPLRCAVHALVGVADPVVSRDEAAAWAGHSGPGFELTALPGGHFYLDDDIAGVAAVVSRVVAPGARGRTVSRPSRRTRGRPSW